MSAYPKRNAANTVANADAASYVEMEILNHVVQLYLLARVVSIGLITRDNRGGKWGDPVFAVVDIHCPWSLTQS